MYHTYNKDNGFEKNTTLETEHLKKTYSIPSHAMKSMFNLHENTAWSIENSTHDRMKIF